MKAFNLALENLLDALHIAHNEADFRAAACRLAGQLGFRWFAYLGFSESRLSVLSSYPHSWARHYLEKGYEKIDPVVRAARSAHHAFHWDQQLTRARPPLERRLFAEAAEYGIRRGVTVPIKGGFRRFAAFTVAGDLEVIRLDQTEFMETLQLAAIYYHAHVYVKLQLGLGPSATIPLTQRERQCLAWAANGKRMAEIAAILGISSRTIAFHLDNARSKLDASTMTQAVAEALRRGLITS